MILLPTLIWSIVSWFSSLTDLIFSGCSCVCSVTSVSVSDNTFLRSTKRNCISISPSFIREVKLFSEKLQFAAFPHSMCMSFPKGWPFSSSLRDVKPTVFTEVIILCSPIHSGLRWSVISNSMPSCTLLLSWLRFFISGILCSLEVSIEAFSLSGCLGSCIVCFALSAKKSGTFW